MNIEELENHRRKYARIVLIAFSVWVITFISLIVNVAVADGSPGWVVLCWVVGLAAVFILYFSLFSKYKKEFKETFARKAITEAFDEVNYEPERGISRADFEATGIFCHFDTYESTDYLSGKYKGVSFEQADIKAEVETTTTDSDGDTSTTYSPVFSGRWIIFDYNKPFKSKVKVLERYFGDVYIYGLTSSIGYEKISMENEAFNKKFHTLSTSQEDAFYLLTPQTMETLLKLEAAEKGRIVFFFNNSKLHVGLNDMKETFSPGFFAILKKTDIEKIHEQMTREIRIIMDFADSLSLDNNLFQDA